MALIKEFADFLVASKDQGTGFGKIMTLGRQQNLLSRDYRLRASRYRIVTDPSADTFCRHVLGAQTIDALDYSNYQGANIIHDLNLPLPEALHKQYDAVIDGGTLEHVFDYPAAIRNAMALLKIGGSFFLSTPANNHFGHGFYQFSADLFYRIFSPANGFRVAKMAIVESYFVDVERGTRSRRYSALDPAVIGGRTTMVSCYPSLLFIHAVKEGEMPDRLCALQSDYATAWGIADGARNSNKLVVKNPSLGKRLARTLVSMMPRRIECWARSRYEALRFYSLNRRSCFVEAPAHYFADNWLERMSKPASDPPSRQ